MFVQHGPVIHLLMQRVHREVVHKVADALKVAALVVHVKVGDAAVERAVGGEEQHGRDVAVAHEGEAQRLDAVVDVRPGHGVGEVHGLQVLVPRGVVEVHGPGGLAEDVLQISRLVGF